MNTHFDFRPSLVVFLSFTFGLWCTAKVQLRNSKSSVRYSFKIVITNRLSFRPIESNRKNERDREIWVMIRLKVLYVSKY